MSPSSARWSRTRKRPISRLARRWSSADPPALAHGELRRKLRYLQHQLEAEQRKLAQFERFVSLIEQGATRDEACEQVYSRQTREASPEEDQAPERPAEMAMASAGPQEAFEAPASL